MERSVVRRAESRFEGARGQSLFRRSWLPPQPEHVMVVAHGYAEHSGRYDALGAWFAARAVAVHALDHQGHGRSAGPRGHIASFDHLLDDLEVFLALVQREHPGDSLALLGHSMGGLLVATLVSERRPAISAALTSSAALALPPSMSRLRILSVRLLRRLMPRLSLASGLDPNGLSRDPKVVRRYIEDPLVFRRMTTSFAAELVGAIERVAQSQREVALPMLVMHGGDDPICPPEGSRAFFQRVRESASLLRIYPKLRHEIFNEPEQEDVFQDALEWLRARKK
ncbi:MAG TPA: lysophospholipase [Myxococcota bacterium]|nr:lysophospholipase [Myxococcota bacterium]